MNKKHLLAFFAFLFLLNSVFAADIAYVVKTAGNSNIERVFIDSGYSYDIITENGIPATNFSNYAMILIQDNVLNRDSIPLDSKNSIFIVNYMTTGNDLVSIVWPGTSISTSSTFTSQFEQIGTPFTEGFSSMNFNAYTTTKPIYYLRIKPNYVNRVAIKTGSGVQYGIVAYSERGNLRNVFFGFPDANYWTDDTKKLFKNSLNWTRIGVDFDGDGYYSDDDCNDNDAGKWQYLPGYRDADADGFGSISQSQVCSGNMLTEGYLSSSGDCNDNNKDINPNALEIPYDGIDNNCDGQDLADVDLDGYCKAGYLILDSSCFKEIKEVGTDCDDNDAGINRGIEDIYKNCKNDAPVVEDIVKIIANENENAVINVKAVDPENDTIIYSINDSRFLENENVFTWETGYYDSGNYVFEISISDGELETFKNVEVQIVDTNQLPVCSNIEDLNFFEDENITFDLNDYCSDSDDDALSFNVQNSSENLIISIINGIVRISAIKDWFGSAFAVFKISDGKGEIETNKVLIDISPENDAPVFDGEISKITFNEDTNLTNALNLNDYFMDVDSTLNFSVSGNSHVVVRINNGSVSFEPEKDWFGTEEITFTASDGELSIDSNEIDVEVIDMDEPPVFQELDCEENIIEDTEYECVLNATDVENSEISFSILNNTDMDCDIDENVLSYISDEDYFGPASCIIRATDSNGSYSQTVLEAIIENVNDAPEIRDFFPKEAPKVMSNTDYRFNVFVFDSDSAANKTWYIENQTAGIGNTFVFNKPEGKYTVGVVVSDEEFSESKFWQVSVWNINHFTCSEARGHVCSENQTCTQEFLGVYDIDRCCPSFCSKMPPRFTAIKIPEEGINLSDNIRVSIVEPVKNARIETRNSTSFKINIENRFNEYVNFDVETYIYDITRDKIIDKKEESFKLEKNSAKNVLFEFSVDEDVHENDEFAIFVRAIGKTKSRLKFFNKTYAEINIGRKERDIAIEDFEITPEEGLLCGDYISAKVDLLNLGRTYENVVIKISSPELKINENSEVGIDNYNGDNEASKTFEWILPKNIPVGEYTIKLNAVFGDHAVPLERKINIETCEQEKTEIQPIETIRVNQESLPVVPIKKDSAMAVFFALEIISIVFIMVILGIAAGYRNKIIREYKTAGQIKLAGRKSGKRK